MKFISIAIAALLLAGCATVADHRQQVRDSGAQKLTLGVAQKHIKVGMSEADVATALGSPNMVTKDRDGVETWIYDRVSTDYAYSTSSGGVAGLVLGFGGSAAGGGIGSAQQASGATSSTQRTLTIIIKFADGAVKSFTYNSTEF